MLRTAIVCFLALGVVSSNGIRRQRQYPLGHMEPLGHQRPMEGRVERVPSGLTPFEFFSRYVETATPVVLTRAIHGTVPHSEWTDMYLKSHFGRNEVIVEGYRKRTQEQSEGTLTLGEFIKIYQRKAVSVNSELPASMKSQVTMPGCIACGGFLNNIHSVNLLFNHGETRFSLRVNPFENLRCAVAGRQEYILMESSHATDISQEWLCNQGYVFGINVDKVDLKRYPNVANVPWYKAVVDEGDCLYLPFHWIHQMSTVDRSIVLGLHWIPFEFDLDQCVQKDMLTVAPQLVSLVDVRLNKFLIIKTLFLEQTREWDGTVYAKDVHHRINQLAAERGEILNEMEILKMFDILLPNCSGEIPLSYLRNNTASDNHVRQLKDYLLLNYLELVDDEFGLSSFDIEDLRMVGVDLYEYGVLSWEKGEGEKEQLEKVLAKKLLQKLEL